MRVVQLPYVAGNPYQHLLSDALAQRGVQVMPGRANAWRLLTDQLFRWRADCLHFHWIDWLIKRPAHWRAPLDLFFVFLQLMVLKAAGVRIVWTVHNVQPHDQKDGSAWIQGLLAKLFARSVHVLYVHGEFSKQLVIRKWAIREARIQVIPHGHYVDHYPCEQSRSSARSMLKIPPAHVCFLFFGLLRPYKGIIELITAFRNLRTAHATLVIAGKPIDENFAQEIQDAIGADARIQHHLRFIPDKDVQTFMHAADVVVLPYRDIMMSGALVLAMGFGRACIAPSIGCFPEMLTSEGGYLYDPNEPRGLEDALHSAASQGHGIIRLQGERNRQRALSWDWTAIASAVHSGYQSREAAANDTEGLYNE